MPAIKSDFDPFIKGMQDVLDAYNNTEPGTQFKLAVVIVLLRERKNETPDGEDEYIE